MERREQETLAPKGESLSSAPHSLFNLNLQCITPMAQEHCAEHPPLTPRWPARSFRQRASVELATSVQRASNTGKGEMADQRAELQESATAPSPPYST